ncbi:hypothetical protein F5B20DRAFT_572517 [Whalleya microplaca]|nr:hypothetical protein F5B20DRAFT_572517 [Whalleya microplaca]
MSRSKDIRGFFKPAGTPSSRPQQATSSSSQPSLDIPSSPRTPPKPSPKPHSRTEEIGCSDDEDEDSDDSLVSLSALLEQKQGPAAYKRETNTTTPKAKRIASYSHNSPLTLQQKKHKFDMKSLISHARQTDRAEESARRADKLMAEEDDDEHQNLSAVQNSPGRLQKAARDLLNSDEEEAKGDKLARAMNRTKVDGSRRVSYFFNLEQPLFKPPRRPFPQGKAKGCWRVLADDPSSRDQAFIIGLPHNIVLRGRTLPDELFLWILNEACVEKNAQLRVQYCDLVTLCADSITRLVDDVQLYSILEKLGGPKYSRGHHKLQTSPELENPYSGRDWTGLVTFLQLLERIAPSLATGNAISAIQLLLRMALDPLVRTTVRNEHFTAMEALISALPNAGTPQWDTACESICTYLYESVEENVLRVVPINYMPNTTSKALDLRRRMAAVTVFRDLSLGRLPVDDAITIEDVMRRLDEPDFRVTRSTDFENLRALVTLLDIVISKAGFMHPHAHPHPHSTPPGNNTTTNTNNSNGDNHEEAEEADRLFDTRIDALTFRLKMVHDKIHDNTLLSRKITKAGLDAVGKRLTYAVRSRPPPKTSIFEPETRRAEDDANVPRQRAFMRNWAQRKAERVYLSLSLPGNAQRG